MLRCPNPVCPGRKRGAFTRPGLQSHFRHYPDCEKIFLSYQVHHPPVPQVPDKYRGENVDMFSRDDDIGSLRDDRSEQEPGTDDGGMQDEASIDQSEKNGNPNDLDSAENNVPNDNSCEMSGNDVSSNHDQHWNDVEDMVMEDPEDHLSLPAEVTLSPISKPPCVYDFKIKEQCSAADWVKQWVDWAKYTPVSDCHPSGKPDDTILLETLLNDPNYKPCWQFVSDTERAEINLMSRLSRIKNCPLFVYDHVRAWVRECLQDGDDSEAFVSNQIFDMMRSREQVLKSLCKLAYTKDMAPITQSIHLPGCGKMVDITTSSYTMNLYYFLTDQVLSNDNTLLLNGNTPYDDPQLTEDYVIDDFNTGTRYVEAWKHKKQDPIDFPLGDVFCVDKSVYDCNDRLSCEPVMHTNSLVRCSTRNKSDAWMSIGYLPQNKSLGHTTYASKLSDYHECLSHIFDEYIGIQQTKSGILWPLAYRGKMFMVRFRPYVLSVLGDTPGQNIMCGKMSMCNRLCRYCDIQKHDLSNPWVESNQMTLSRQLHIQDSAELREEYCYKEIDVFWNKADFGNDPRGIHGNVPGEILHAYMKGIVLRVHECIVASPRLSAKAQKKDNRALRENAEEETRLAGAVAVTEKAKEKRRVEAEKAKHHKTQPSVPKQEDLVKAGVFGGKMGKRVDAIAMVLGEQLAHQSDKNICRLYFPQGLMTRSKTTASEQQGLTLLMSIILSSTWSLEKGGLRDRLGDKRTGSYIKIMENLMCLEEVFKMHPGKGPDPLKKSDIPAVAMYTKSILKLITEEVKRDSGDGFNLIKFHLITHMISEDIFKYGLPRNISGCAGESQFKDNFKLPASTTQKRDYSFDKQVATRHHEHLTNRRCLQRLARIDKLDIDVDIDSLEGLRGNSLAGVQESLNRDTKLVRSRTTLTESMFQLGFMCTAVIIPKKKRTKSTAAVQEKILPLSEHTLDISYIGKTVETARAASLPCFDSVDHCLVDATLQPCGLPGMAGLRSMNISFKAITKFLSPLFCNSRTLQVKLFTKLYMPKKAFQEKDILYRADPFCTIGNKERHDWALIQWTGDYGQVPGMLLSFLDIDDRMMVAFNSTICSGGNDALPKLTRTGHYALVQSLKEEIPGLVDPTLTELEQKDIMQMNSVLLFYGEKEVDDVDRDVKVRLVHVDTIIRPLIVVPDFDPTFVQCNTGTKIDRWVRSSSRENSVIVLRPRDLWHSTFIHLAKDHFANNQ